MDFSRLTVLYLACQQLQYELLANMAWNRLRELIWANACWDIDMSVLKYLIHRIPVIVEVIAESLLLYTSWDILEEDMDNFKYVGEILNDPQIGELLEIAMDAKLESWVACSTRWYSSKKNSFDDDLRYHTRQGQLARRECYSCGGRGHMARNCKVPANVKTAHKARLAAAAKAASKMSASANSKSKRTVAGTTTPSKIPAAKVSAPSTASNTKMSNAQVKTDSTVAGKPSYASVVAATASKQTVAPSRPAPWTANAPSQTKGPIQTQTPVQGQVQPSVNANAVVTVHSQGSVINNANAPLIVNTQATGTVHNNPTPATPASEQSRRPRRNCYNCGKLGHIARNCWAPPQYAYQSNNSGVHNGYRGMPSPN